MFCHMALNVLIEKHDSVYEILSKVESLKEKKVLLQHVKFFFKTNKYYKKTGNIFNICEFHDIKKRSNCFAYIAVFSITSLIAMDNYMVINTSFILAAITFVIILASTLSYEIFGQFSMKQRSLPLFLINITTAFFCVFDISPIICQHFSSFANS